MIGKEFISAGNAVFTLEIPSDFAESHGTPNHYTFKVRKKEADDRFPETCFVSLLTGPENTSDYSYLGILNPSEGTVRLTAKSRVTDESMVVKLLRRVLSRLWKDEGNAIESAGFKLHHEGKCGRCGRMLTVPESIESGIGPECRKLMA